MSISIDTMPQTPPSTPPKHASPVSKSRGSTAVARFSAHSPSPQSKVRQVRQTFEDEEGMNGEGSSDAEAIASKEAGSATIPQNLFKTEHSRIMFKAVDRLQSICTMETGLSMPQLIIVGGQSSGKSSLLKTLTRIPFPTDVGCCTRFPTRIVSTRTAPGTPESYRISIDRSPIIVKGILPAPKGYEKYQRTGSALTLDHFTEIMKEVSQKLGIRKGPEADKRNFASEVLKIELNGPRRTQYSILDLPGQFRRPGEVKEEDPALITDMIVQYLKQPENIVICVADVPTDLDNQEIPGLVNRHADKDRTIGVFTKCDMTSKNPEMAKSRVKIGKGLTNDNDLYLPNGWFFVRNRLASDPDDLDLDSEEEKLFSEDPWNELRKERCGSKALMSHLSKVLDSKIRDRFPTFRQYIIEQLHANQKRRDDLGLLRTSHAEKRQYVGQVAQSFENQVYQSLHRNGYQSQNLQIVSKEEKLEIGFDTVMRSYGMAWKFQEDGRYDETKSCVIRPPATTPRPIAELAYSDGVYAAYGNVPKVQTAEAFIDTINKGLADFQAGQLWTIINPDMFHKTYLDQVKNWRQIVQIYLSQIREVVRSCMEAILCKVCPNEDGSRKLHEGLTHLLQGYFDEACRKMEENCEEQCKREMDCKKLHPGRSTDCFKQHLGQRRAIRWKEAFEKLDYKGIDPVKIAIESLNTAHWSVGNNMAHEVHDVVKGYYDISLEIFISNINDEVKMFVYGENSPLRRLSYNTAMNLSEEEIDLLGSEDKHTRMTRKRLGEENKTWTEALQIVDEATQKTRDLERS